MQQDLSQLAQKFQAFARVESQAMSPFYSAMSERIWQDDDVLAIASNVSTCQPPTPHAIRCGAFSAQPRRQCGVVSTVSTAMVSR